MRKTALAFLLAMLPGLAAAQQQVIPGLVLPPTTVIGNTSPFSGNAVAVPFSSLQASLGVPATQTCPASNWFSALAIGGVWTCSRPAITDISGLGTGIAAALALNVGSGGAPILFNGAGGTPSSISLINGTGLPVLTGISGLGTGVAGALGINIGSTGAPVLFNGAGGTPTSLVGTNITGTAAGLTAGTANAVAVGNITGLGGGVATFLGTPSSANLAAAVTGETGTGPLVFATSPALVAPDLGTPFAGVITNLSGTCTACTSNTFTQGNAGNLNNGTLPAARTNGHMNGTATNDNAAAGEVGEYIETVLLQASATSLTTSTAKDIVTVSLTAGDWDVSGAIGFLPGATTSITVLFGGWSTVANTTDTTAGKYFQQVTAAQVPTNIVQEYAIPTYRFSLSGTTTVRLIGLSIFTASTNTAFGLIRARRVR